jgi:hypothetical protein
MARSTLSFFSRLFSSKKKKILEKRNLYEHSGDLGSNDTSRSESFYQSSPEVENGFLKTSVASLKAEANAGGTFHGTLPRMPFESNEQLRRNYDDNADAVVSVVKLEEGEVLDRAIEVNRTEGEKLAQENTNSNSDQLSNDDDLEYESMVLLSKLEQLMIKISDNTVQKSIPLVLEALIEMVNHVVEFAEKLPVSEQKKISLQRLLQRDDKNYKVLNLMYINNERLDVEMSPIVNSQNAKEFFINLSNDLLRLINVYLSANVKAFKSEHIGEQWKTLYTGFFVNLTKSIRNSQSDHQR